MVYKRISVIFVIIFMSSCGNTVGAEKQPQVFEKQSVSVAIKKVEGSCSEIELSYHVNEFSHSVVIPKTIVGYGGSKFSFSVLSLTGDKRLPMLVTSVTGDEDVVSWDMNSSPYVVNVDLRDYFNLEEGMYYIQYLYSFKPYKGGVDSESWVFDVIKSERYYIEFNDFNCISDFLD